MKDVAASPFTPSLFRNIGKSVYSREETDKSPYSNFPSFTGFSGRHFDHPLPSSPAIFRHAPIWVAALRHDR
jgi:hypothetical protein